MSELMLLIVQSVFSVPTAPVHLIWILYSFFLCMW